MQEKNVKLCWNYIPFVFPLYSFVLLLYKLVLSIISVVLATESIFIVAIPRFHAGIARILARYLCRIELRDIFTLKKAKRLANRLCKRFSRRNRGVIWKFRQNYYIWVPFQLYVQFQYNWNWNWNLITGQPVSMRQFILLYVDTSLSLTLLERTEESEIMS